MRTQTSGWMLTALLAVAFAGGLFAQTGVWTETTSTASSRRGHTLLEFSNRMWVLGGTASSGAKAEVWSSADGANWVNHLVSAPWGARTGHTSVVHNGRMWLMGGSGGGTSKNDVWSSADGVNWTQEAAHAAWRARTGHTSVVYNNRLWVIGGRGTGGADVWSSPDGVNWTQETGTAGWNSREGHASGVINNRLWVFGGASLSGISGNDVWSSADGVNWNQEASAGWSSRSFHSAVVHNSRVYVMGGVLGSAPWADVWSSPDGLSWTLEAASPGWVGRADSAAVGFNGKLWINGGWDGSNQNSFRSDVWSSPAGVNWSQDSGTSPAPQRAQPGSVVFNNRMWIIGGFVAQGISKNDVWSSGDGISWTQETAAASFPSRGNHTVVVHSGRMYVMGGENFGSIFSDVWSSSDGINWALESVNTWGASSPYTAPGRTNQVSAVFNGRIWVVGGITSAFRLATDIWSSSDGATWVQESATVPWTTYGNSRMEVFNNRLWLMGGGVIGGSSGASKEIWSSADGVNWTLETSDPGWLARAGHASAVFDSRLWLMGGNAVGPNGNYVGFQSDVWSSADGITWTQETSNALFTDRMYTGSLAFDNRLWVICGWTTVSTGSISTSDVWAYSEGVAPQITSTPVTTAVANSGYNYSVTVAGSLTPYVIAVGMPTWMSFDRGTGELQGTPALSDVGSTATITLSATNAHGVDTQSFQVIVKGTAPVFTSMPVTVATAGSPYTYTVSAAGGPPVPTLSVLGLPAWLSFDPVTRVLSGLPGGLDIGQTGLITVTATNGTNPDALQSFQIDVSGTAPQIVGMPRTSVVVGEPYTYRVTTLGAPQATLTVSALPAWLSFNPTTGEFAGNPEIGDVGSTVSVEVSADNGWGAAVQQFQITVLDNTATGDRGSAAGCASGRGPSLPWLALLGLLTGVLILKRRWRNA